MAISNTIFSIEWAQHITTWYQLLPIQNHYRKSPTIYQEAYLIGLNSLLTYIIDTENIDGDIDFETIEIEIEQYHRLYKQLYRQTEQRYQEFHANFLMFKAHFCETNEWSAFALYQQAIEIYQSLINISSDKYSAGYLRLITDALDIITYCGNLALAITYSEQALEIEHNLVIKGVHNLLEHYIPRLQKYLRWLQHIYHCKKCTNQEFQYPVTTNTNYKFMINILKKYIHPAHGGYEFIYADVIVDYCLFLKDINQQQAYSLIKKAIECLINKYDMIEAKYSYNTSIWQRAYSTFKVLFSEKIVPLETDKNLIEQINIFSKKLKNNP